MIVPAFFRLFYYVRKKSWEVEPGNEAMLVSHLISELIFVLEEDIHSDVNKVDTAVERVHLQGNTVGQSAADSQGKPITYVDISMTMAI